MGQTKNLLCGAAVIALATSANAQTQTSTSDAMPDAAGPIAAAPEAGSAGAGGEIVVLGFGQSRQVQSVTAKDIGLLTPGSSPLKAVEKLPGVNFQSADAFGAYEWAVRISLRGFNQNQLGFTLDGVPLGDMSYGNVNGLHISRAIISENVGRVDVAQGAGALGTASTSNLGGTIEFFSRNPGDRFDVQGSGTYGADDTYRAFARVETGDLTGNGLKGYLSYGYLHTDKWKGAGSQYQHQANAKLVADMGSFGSIAGFFDFSDRRETDYQDLSKDIIRRLGLRDDNLTKDSLYPLAIRIAQAARAGTPLPAPYGTVDDSYFDAGGIRRDYLSGVTVDAHLTPTVGIRTTGYYHNNRGQGSWILPYAVTPLGAPNVDGTPITNPAPIGYRTTEYSIHRGGAISTAAWNIGVNRLEIGGWYESNTFSQARRFYGMTDTPTPNRDTLDFQRNPYATQWDYKYDTETIQYHVQDTLRLFDDRLVVNGGWKGFRVKSQAGRLPDTTSPLAEGSIRTRDWFQPQAGAVFKIVPQAELFADYKENVRAFQASATVGPFSTTQVGFDNIGRLRPETSRTYEGGARFHAGGFQASAVGYYIEFSNRLLQYTVGLGPQGNPSILQNVGDVHSYGAELTANYRVFGPLSVYGSYSYNHSEYRDDVFTTNRVTGARTLFTATKGRDVVDNPEHMVKGEVAYDDGNIFGRAGIDYMSKRFFTYLNDQSVGGRALVDASLGYRFTGEGALKNLSVEASVTNLTDKSYIATVGSNGFTASGDYQTLLAGAPRQWFVSIRKGF